MRAAWSRLTVLAALVLFVYGCGAAMGTMLEVGGALSGEKSLSNAGKSMKRAADTQGFSEEEKYYTGRTVAAQLLVGEKPSSDRSLESYIGKVGHTLVLASGTGEMVRGWHFMLLDDKHANAYACPGGLVFVSRGLVELCDSEDELAGAIAHEIAHVGLDHPMQAISAANQKAALVSLAQFGMQKAFEGSELESMTETFDKAVAEVGKSVAKGYDRGKEAEADLAAVEMLAAAGYDPAGLAKLLRKLRSGDSSHGDPGKRASDVENKIKQQGLAGIELSARTKRFEKAVGR